MERFIYMFDEDLNTPLQLSRISEHKNYHLWTQVKDYYFCYYDFLWKRSSFATSLQKIVRDPYGFYYEFY